MLILGLDPGSLHTGYGLVERHGSSLLPVEAGRFSCPKDLALPERLAHLAGRLQELLARRPPDLAVLETPFHGMNARSLIVLAQARGALLAVLAGRGIEIREYSPAEVKSAVTGNGRADKDQVARMVRLLLAARGEGWASDATDALAVAICCAQRLRLDRLADP
ncbi:MAG TPA: crossover junction endodeoxyribonuclease RuvC [Thermoanaerobaculia bacterium]|nr:crossover junction endodeoxyribonuclease RuvC [Thermoanaerobaculia bacterium]